MIIVSQDGKNIINLNNVINIEIQDYEYNLDPRDSGTELEVILACAKSITAWVSNNKSIILGNYPSLDRAKEILEELVKFYRLDDKKEDVQPLDALALINIREHSTFYMPKNNNRGIR